MAGLKVIKRDICPLDPNLKHIIVAEVPYSAEIFATTRRKLPGLEKLNYTIHYAPKADFYWQEMSADSSTLPQNNEAQTSIHSKPDLARYAHTTEEAILFRLLLKGIEHPSVFDFGMGEGLWLMMMQAWGMQAHGHDVSAYSKTVSERHGITFRPLEEYPDGSFDVINAQEVFEHLSDPVSAAQLAAQKLKSGGIFKISTPGGKKIKSRLLKLRRGGYKTAGNFEKELGALEPM